MEKRIAQKENFRLLNKRYCYRCFELVTDALRESGLPQGSLINTSKGLKLCPDRLSMWQTPNGLRMTYAFKDGDNFVLYSPLSDSLIETFKKGEIEYLGTVNHVIPNLPKPIERKNPEPKKPSRKSTEKKSEYDFSLLPPKRSGVRREIVAITTTCHEDVGLRRDDLVFVEQDLQPPRNESYIAIQTTGGSIYLGWFLEDEQDEGSITIEVRDKLYEYEIGKEANYFGKVIGYCNHTHYNDERQLVVQPFRQRRLV